MIGDDVLKLISDNANDISKMLKHFSLSEPLDTPKGAGKLMQM